LVCDLPANLALLIYALYDQTAFVRPITRTL
jgi:hypothetical protein